MKKLLMLSLLLYASSASSLFAQLNMTLKGKLAYADDLASVWGYAANGKEYALVGAYKGLSIVDVTNPSAPMQVQFVTTNSSSWHEMKTWSHYAYVVNESGGGMLIVDLSGLPGTVTYSFFTAGSLNLQTGHTVQIDENGICYVNGSNISVGGVLFFDLNQDPMNPVYLGEYESNYVHDSNIRNNIMWTSEIYKGWFRAIDVSNKTNPIQLAQQSTPGNFNHNTALSDNGSYIYTTDEVSNSNITSYNVSDLGNITELDRFQANPGTNSIGHNVHVKGNFLVIAYYRDGVIIADATYPDNLIKVGSYDTSPSYSGSGYNGCWEAYPYLPSGNILASDIEEGLYVLGVTYTPACYLNGTVTDYSTGAVLNGVTVSITNASGSSTTTNLAGYYATGYSTAGTYSVTFSKSGYSTKTITHVNLSSGITTLLNTTLKNSSLPQCVTPTGLTATNITSSTATLKWSDEYVSSYTLKLKNTVTNGVTSYTPYVNTLNVTGLSSCTTYKFRVKGKCTSTGQFTAFSSWYTFNTGGNNCKNILEGEAILGNEELNLFPNPFNHQFEIALYLNTDDAVTISLYDVAGRLVKEAPPTNYLSGLNHININTGDLSNGIYFCAIKTSEGVVVRKVVKE